MTIKVTFKPLSRGRYRIIVDGVLRGITKNPKKTRWSLVRAHDAPRIHELKLEHKRKMDQERYVLSSKPSSLRFFGYLWD